MNATTYRQFFGDADRDFVLGLPQVEELERQTQAGFGALSKRILAGTFFLGDLHQIIRLALIGGGTAPVEAHDLMRAYVHPRPIEEAQLLAINIVAAAFYGIRSASHEDSETNA